MSGTLAIVGYDYELEEMEKDVPLCSMEEFSKRLRVRDDIFLVDKDRLLRNIQTVCIVLAIVSGIWLSHQTYIKHNTPEAHTFIQELKDGRQVIVRTLEIEREKIMPKPKQIEKPTQLTMKKIKPKPNTTKGKRHGGGDPRSRVMKMGVLGFMADQVLGENLVYSDPLAKGGYHEKIDAILAGTGGLKKGNMTGTGRKGEIAMGFGPGSGGGFGTGTDGVDDLINGLMTDDIGSLPLKNPTKVKISTPVFTNGEKTIVGGRSRASIMRVVQTNITSLRHAYNKRLREVPNLRGKVKIRFAIDEFGKVIFCDVTNSSIGDEQLEKILCSKIKRWVFEKIDKPGDVTEVMYPFVFSM